MESQKIDNATGTTVYFTSAEPNNWPGGGGDPLRVRTSDGPGPGRGFEGGASLDIEQSTNGGVSWSKIGRTLTAHDPSWSAFPAAGARLRAKYTVGSAGLYSVVVTLSR